MYRYICDVCGNKIDGKTVESVVETAQNHLVNVHGLDDVSDVDQPSLAEQEDVLRERTKEIESYKDY